MNILAIGAHFDDVELGCGGALAKYRAEGHKTFMYVVSDSGYTVFDKKDKVVRNKAIALREGNAAAKIIGAKLTVGSYRTNNISFDDGLVVSIKKIIEGEKIDRIFTHWAYDVHQDHYNIARATLSAARHVPNLLMYRSNWYISDREFKGNYFIDISACFEKKVLAIKEHKSELKRVGNRWLHFISNDNRNNGISMGVEYAEAFEVVKSLEK